MNTTMSYHGLSVMSNFPYFWQKSGRLSPVFKKSEPIRIGHTEGVIVKPVAETEVFNHSRVVGRSLVILGKVQTLLELSEFPHYYYQ